MAGIKKDILDMSYDKYDKIMGIDDFETTKDGLIRLVPTTKYIEKQRGNVTTTISSLEEILKEKYKEKENLEKIEVKAMKIEEKSKDKKKKKKQKEEKQSLLKAIFSAVDSPEDEDDPEGGEYVEKKERKKREKKDPDTTLDTQLGKRFSTVVSYVHDTINDFDRIEKQIQAEIDANKNKAKGMYMSAMTANLISAKTGKLNAIKELTAINKTLTDIEFKKAKESKEDDKDDTKLIASFGASLLKGKFSGYEEDKKKDKKKKKNKLVDDDDDDDGDEDDKNLSKAFANSLKENKRDLTFTAHERHIEIEGKYKLVVVADPFEPQEDWKFVALDKNGDKIDNFAEDYKGIVPKKKNCKMIFDTTKMEVKDKATNKKYKLIFKR